MPSKTSNNLKKLSTVEMADPQHYKKRGGIEPVDYIVSNKMSFIEGSITKYIYRRKRGDLAKIIRYTTILIEKEGDN